MILKIRVDRRNLTRICETFLQCSQMCIARKTKQFSEKNYVYLKKILAKSI